MPEDLIGVEPGRVVRIFLSNPPLNLISLEVINRLREVLSKIVEQRSARAVVLASRVPAVFSAGADVRQLARLGTHAAEERLMAE
jgi:enoyl-CoA hydratase/carnithine racemase